MNKINGVVPLWSIGKICVQCGKRTFYGTDIKNKFYCDSCINKQSPPAGGVTLNDPIKEPSKGVIK